jgi:hypothetical protein
MKNFLLNAQFFSMCIGGFCLLLLLGAEPGTSESSMYEYEHFCDKGNFGWYLLWALCLSFVTFVFSTAIRLYKKI